MKKTTTKFLQVTHKSLARFLFIISFMMIANISTSQTRLQTATGNTGLNTQSSMSVSLGSVPQNGNTLIAVISGRTSNNNNVTSISVSSGTVTWAKAVSNSGNGINIEIWYTTAMVNAGTDFTINQSSARSAVVIMEYTGLLYASPLDRTANDDGNSSSPKTGTTATTTVGPELWIGGFGLRSSGVSLTSTNNGFVEIDNAFSQNATSGNNARVYALERKVSATGTATTEGDLSSSVRWAGAVATFKRLITGFSPPAVCFGPTASVTLLGEGFSSPANATAVKFNGTTASAFTVNSNTQITATLPAGASSGLISVTNSAGDIGYSESPLIIRKMTQPMANIVNASCPTASNGSVTLTNIPTAINFNANQSQYINLGSTLLNSLTGFTMEGWIKTTAYNRNSFFGQDNAIEIGFASNGVIELWSEGLSTNLFAPLAAYPRDGEWHHVAGIGNGQNLLIYVDGILVASRSHNGLSAPANYGSSNNTAKIGGFVWDSGSPNYFDGQIIKVGFWNRALSSQEVVALASIPYEYSSNDNGLIAGYNFFEAAGTSLARTPTATPSGNLIGSVVPTWSDICTYSWTKTGGGYNQSSKNISNLPLGIYTVNVTLAGCTSNSNSFEVVSTGQESSAPTSITGNSPICQNSSVILTLNGGNLGTAAAWKWYSGACGTNPITTGLTNGGRTLTISPTTTTTYFARAEGTCNTTACASFTVVVNATGTWLGTTNTDWNTASNWCGSVPTLSTDVIIPTTPVGNRFPIVGTAGAVCKSLTINAGATVTMDGAFAFNLHGNITNNGSFVPATSTVTYKASGAVLGSATTTFHHLIVDASQTFTASASTMNITGNWTNNGTFTNNNGTVAFTGTTAQEIKGTNTFNNLTINNTAGVVGKNDITVNAVLNLASVSPNETNGTLEMTNSYGDYSNIETPDNEKTTRRTAQCDILDSHILFMGANATTIGAGDVTGKVKRTTINENTAYSFGNLYNTITFNKNGTGTLPTAITFVITKGSDRGIHANKTDAVKRLYQVIRTGGTLPTSFTLKFHYKNDELNGIQKDTLVLWDHHIPYSTVLTPHEHGKTAQNLTENWLELSGHGINYLDTQEVIGGTTKYWLFAATKTTGNTWLGAVFGDVTNWNNPSNWSAGNVPICENNVIIPNVLNSPTIPSTGANAQSIEIRDGATLNGGTGGELIICGGIATNGGKGSWSNNGTFNAGTSTVTFDYPRTTNAETSTISGNTTFYNLKVNASTYLVIQADANTSVSNTMTQTGNLDARTYLNTFSYTGGNAQTVVNPAVGNGYRNLILSGAGTKTLPSSVLKVSGDLTLNSGFSATSNTIEFDGSILQTLSGSSTSALNNVTMNNAAGLTLSKNQTVNGTLTLTNGLVNTGSNVLTVNCTGDITGQNSASYISGKLAREYCSALSKQYPIGMGGNYRPISLEYTSLSGGSSTVQAEQIESEIQGSIPNDINYQTVRYWNLSETAGVGNGNFKITLDGSPFVANATPKILRGNGTTNVAFDASFLTPNFTTSDNFSDNVFGNFAVASECLPPVITTAPQNTVACELNSTPTFTVVPEAGTYTYAWEVNTGSGWNAVSNGGVYSNANTATLTITNPTYSMNAYSYRAKVARDCGGIATSATATLTINPQPQGSLSGVLNICKGDEGFLTWTATLGTGPYTVVYNAGDGNVTVNDVVSGAAFSVGNVSLNTTFTLVSVTGQNCSRTANFTVGSANITVNPYITWTGAINRDWNTAGNWCGGIPTVSDNVQIPNLTNQPLISNTPTAITKSMIIDNNSSVTISGDYVLQVAGNLTNNGSLLLDIGTLDINTQTSFVENNGWIETKNTSATPIPNTGSYGGTVVFSGAAQQILYGGTFKDIIVDNSAGVVMPADAIVVANGTLEVKMGSTITIGTGRSITANKVINAAGTNGVLLSADAEKPNGSLIFNNRIDEPVEATVQMYSPAYWTTAINPSNSKLVYTYYWQFMGIPVKKINDINPAFYGAFVRRHNEAGFGTSSSTPLLNRLWIQLQNGNSMSAVKGYELAQVAPKTYSFEGELFHADIDTTLSHSLTGQYPGQHILSNPYPSAIRIRDIIFGNNTDSVAYLYNTGSYAQWNNNKADNGSAAGMYIAAPRNTAGTADIPGEIPPMQGFLVRTNNTQTGSIYISYNNTKTRTTTKQRAPQALSWLKLNMHGTSGNGDVMWLFSSNETTNGYDNGWDGIKMQLPSGIAALYSWNESGSYQINALPNVHQTSIGFRANKVDTKYSISFEHSNMMSQYNELYFYDKTSGDIIDISLSGTEYEFDASNQSHEDRFMILTSMPSTTQAQTQANDDSKINVFSAEHSIFVDNKTNDVCKVDVFDISGQHLYHQILHASSLNKLDIHLIPSVYIVKVANEKVASKNKVTIK